MSSIVSTITTLVSSSVSWITTAVGAVMASGNELLLFFVLISFCSIGFGLFRRFFA